MKVTIESGDGPTASKGIAEVPDASTLDEAVDLVAGALIAAGFSPAPVYEAFGMNDELEALLLSSADKLRASRDERE